MNDSERFHALMRLAEFRNTRIAIRRDHEWKVTLGLWAILAAGMLKFPHTTMPWLWWAVILALVIIVIGHAALWVRSHWVRSQEDVRLSFYYSDRAENLAVVDGKKLEEKERPGLSCCDKGFGFLSEGRCWAQIGTTALIAIGVALRASGYW